ncbi:MAG: hypothetical protein RM368_03570 [Nostoc sp. DedSLP03]|nr:hypothetical protein [Nostoc sp. DedSLP03]
MIVEIIITTLAPSATRCLAIAAPMPFALSGQPWLKTRGSPVSQSL